MVPQQGKIIGPYGNLELSAKKESKIWYPVHMVGDDGLEPPTLCV